MPLPGTFVRNVEIPLQDTPYDMQLVGIPYAIAPIVVGSLELRAQTVIYEPDSAYTAIQLIRQVQLAVLTQITALDNLYRLMANFTHGTVYSTDIDGITTPPITALPPTVVEDDSALAFLSNLPKAIRLWENAVYGTFHAGDYEAPEGILTKLDTIATAEGADDATLEQIETAVELAAVLLG